MDGESRLHQKTKGTTQTEGDNVINRVWTSAIQYSKIHHDDYIYRDHCGLSGECFQRIRALA